MNFQHVFKSQVNRFIANKFILRVVKSLRNASTWMIHFNMLHVISAVLKLEVTGNFDSYFIPFSVKYYASNFERTHLKEMYPEEHYFDNVLNFRNQVTFFIFFSSNVEAQIGIWSKIYLMQCIVNQVPKKGLFQLVRLLNLSQFCIRNQRLRKHILRYFAQYLSIWNFSVEPLPRLLPGEIKCFQPQLCATLKY